MTRPKIRQAPRLTSAFVAVCERLEPRIALSGPTFVVRSAADSGDETLRQAILESHDLPDLTIDFDIKGPARTINLLSPLPPILSTVTIDGASQPGFGGTPLVTVNGSATGPRGLGFDFEPGSDGSAVEGLELTGFAGAAITVNGASSVTIGGSTVGQGNVIAGNPGTGIKLTTIAGPNGGVAPATSGIVIAGNKIGTDASGQNALANAIGVLITGGSATTIGGMTAGAGNVISGNATAGIELNGDAVSGTLIAGNKIGTNPAGTAAVVRSGQSDSLLALQNAGIAIIGSQGNIIGGTSIQARNLISGNYVGVMLATIAGSESSNLVLGNLIGTDASGQKALGNQVGVYINGATRNQIGGTAPGSANIISGNSSVGVEIYGSGSTANLVEGNMIGLAEDGRSALRGSRGLLVQSVGVFIEASSGNAIGGSVSGAGNVLSGNGSAGVFILSRAGVSRANAIRGNFIGLAESGRAGPGNDGYGILLDNAPANPIGRAGAASNHFGRNTFGDIRIYAGPATASSSRRHTGV